MAKVVAPLSVRVEVIGRPRESSYEAGKFYYPTLFIDLSQPEGSEAGKIWKNLSEDEVSQIQRGDCVQLIPAGKDKSGKDKHNIVLLESPATAPDPQHAQPTPIADGWTPEQKRAIASKVQQHADLLAYCLETAHKRFGDLVSTEESIRCLGTTLYLSVLRGENR